MNGLLYATHTRTLGPWIPGLTFQGLKREMLRDGERDEKKERGRKRKKREERRTEGMERGEIKKGVGVCCVEEAAKTHTQRP